MPKILLEGQEIILTPEQAATDQAITDTLLPFYPDIANATFKRTENEGETLIEIVKRPGTKGNIYTPLQILKDSPEYINPVILLAVQLKALEIQGALTLETLILLQPTLQNTTQFGEKESTEIKRVASALKSASPIPAKTPILGF
ncbi:hypothetical protein MC7420_4144 [Coleofasciculus chthonoplastes PCC 7420]|uniref:Uncharacterized protein n=1 Tax=Coleofasciculus chthonoplastes PCC 7420 TaxID=118168 RepID=B4VVA1_9CYAN|nr:hypothetical protein [Coleofasciculus chthonoplastes]EDX74159.1 hypothetical protein MC7420_4144 [Coleofasciculus chthonoplastes PCC 7420]